MTAPLTAIGHEQTCEICMEDDNSFMMSQSCGHLICDTCEYRLRRRTEMPFHCPFCRKSLETKPERVYKGEISCHICRKLKDCEEIWWCGECRSFLCSNCQLKNHGVSHKSHEIEEFGGNGKTKAAIVAAAYLKFPANAGFLEDKTNYANHLQDFLGPIVQKISEDTAHARKENFLYLRHDLKYAFGSNRRNDQNQEALITDDVVFEQLSKLARLDTAPAPISLPSQSSYFAAADVDARSTEIKILIESLQLSHFNIVGDYFTIARRNKIFLGKLPDLNSSPVKIPALKLLYEFKDHAEDSKVLEIENRFALSTFGENGITLAVLTKIKPDCSDQWKLTISEIIYPDSTVPDALETTDHMDLTDIVPTDSTFGAVIGMKIFAPRKVRTRNSGDSFYILVNFENGSEILELNYELVWGWDKHKPPRSIHRVSEKIQSFAVFVDGIQIRPLQIAMVYSDDEEKVIAFEARDTAPVSRSTRSHIADGQASSGMDKSSITFNAPIKSLDFATGTRKKSRLVTRTEDGNVFFMRNLENTDTKPLKQLSINKTAKISPINQTRYVVLDEETGMMRMVILM